LVAPAIATKFRPGQFVTIAVGGPETSMLGRRAFAVHDVRPDHGGTVEFVFAAHGPGTRWLASLRARDVLDTVGPLGRPFPIPRDPSSCLLLGVGYGSAPLFALAARLRERGCSIDYLLGGDSADRVFGALTARRNGRSTAVATTDGSFGARGPVTGLMEQIIRDARTDVIYASAPVLVLAAAGCAGAGRELAQFIDVARVGALVSKSIMAEPHTGNPAPRLAETPSGLLNSVGLQNPGIDAFLQRDLPWLLSRGARVVVSIAGQTIREYAGLAARL